MTLGRKAFNLIKLKQAGFNVPKFEVLKYGLFTASDIHERVSECLQKINSESYAVRSSANLEDEKIKSFAGMFETYLNVKSEDVAKRAIEVNQAIKIPKQYLEAGKIEMSVIIQKFIEPEISGVCFTNLNNNLVINLHKGSGEDLVSGRAKAEEIVIDRNTFCFKEKPDLLLNYSHLVRLFLKIEKHFESSQDIEFCVSKGELYLLQTRAVTGQD